MKTRIYHNHRCSKSRATLELLRDRDLEIEVIDYLSNPPSADRLRSLLKKLGLKPRDIIRSNEPEFKASGLTLDAPADALVELMTRKPKIIERPIVEIGQKARLGRPPEQVLEIIE